MSDPQAKSAAVDRYGNEATDRARDRTGPIAFMARNGVASNLLLIQSNIVEFVTEGESFEEHSKSSICFLDSFITNICNLVICSFAILLYAPLQHRCVFFCI